MLDIQPISLDSLEELVELLGTQRAARGCWCMWFIIPVRDFHAAGTEGNRAAMSDLIQTSAEAPGLLARLDDQTVGWCAVGPRERFARAIKTPTFKSREPSEDADVWLIPCMYVHPEHRNVGISEALLQAAVDLAKRYGAHAIEGFPYTGAKRRSTATQVGFESVFGRCGFEPIRWPSDSRAIVRRTL